MQCKEVTLNFLNLAGHLGADPEVRFTSNGKKITTLRLATKIRKGNNDETLWWRVSIWGEQFDNMMPYLKKGSPIVVMGELSKPEIYTDRNGQPQISMAVTASNISFSPFGRSEKSESTNVSPKPDAQNVKNNDMEKSFNAANEQNQSFAANSMSNQDISDDEVPF